MQPKNLIDMNEYYKNMRHTFYIHSTSTQNHEKDYKAVASLALEKSLYAKVETNVGTIILILDAATPAILQNAKSLRSKAFGVGHTERYLLAFSINEAISKEWPPFLECSKELNRIYNINKINAKDFSKLEAAKQIEIFKIFQPALQQLESIIIYTGREPCNEILGNCKSFLSNILNGSKYKIYCSTPYMQSKFIQEKVDNYNPMDQDLRMQHIDATAVAASSTLDAVMLYYYNYYQKPIVYSNRNIDSSINEYIMKLEMILQYRGFLDENLKAQWHPKMNLPGVESILKAFEEKLESISKDLSYMEKSKIDLTNRVEEIDSDNRFKQVAENNDERRKKSKEISGINQKLKRAETEIELLNKALELINQNLISFKNPTLDIISDVDEISLKTISPSKSSPQTLVKALTSEQIEKIESNRMAAINRRKQKKLTNPSVASEEKSSISIKNDNTQDTTSVELPERQFRPRSNSSPEDQPVRKKFKSDAAVNLLDTFNDIAAESSSTTDIKTHSNLLNETKSDNKKEINSEAGKYYPYEDQLVDKDFFNDFEDDFHDSLSEEEGKYKKDKKKLKEDFNDPKILIEPTALSLNEKNSISTSTTPIKKKRRRSSPANLSPNKQPGISPRPTKILKLNSDLAQNNLANQTEYLANDNNNFSRSKKYKRSKSLDFGSPVNPKKLDIAKFFTPQKINSTEEEKIPSSIPEANKKKLFFMYKKAASPNNTSISLPTNNNSEKNDSNSPQSSRNSPP